MTFPTHLLAGLIVGKLTGNYSLGIVSSVAMDVDHLQSYFKSGVIFKPKVFWQTITNPADPYGNQRGYLHNVLVFIVISGVLFMVLRNIALPIVLGWLGHLILDALDNSDYWPFYPNKKINLKGPIIFASRWEILFTFLLVGIYFLV